MLFLFFLQGLEMLGNLGCHVKKLYLLFFFVNQGAVFVHLLDKDGVEFLGYYFSNLFLYFFGELQFFRVAMNKMLSLLNRNGVGKFFHHLFPFLIQNRMVFDIGRWWDITMYVLSDLFL
jgi:hypothetical protein